EFFSSNEFDVTRPADKFTTNDINYLMPRKIFLAQKITSVDTFSCKLYATQIISDLLRFHLDDKDPYAMVHVDLTRLNFMRNQSAHSEKDSIYNESLKALATDVSNHESWAEVQYHMINYVCDQAAKYNPDVSDKHKWNYKTALAMCDVVSQKFPKSYGAGLCIAKKASIESRSISFQVEECVVPDQPSIAVVNYRNVKKAWFRIINVGWDFDETYDYYDDTKYIKKLLSYKPVKTFELDLKDDGDYQPHQIDFALSAMPAGAYYVLSSATPDFKITQNNIGYTPFNVSNIAYISTKEPETEKYNFWILNRNNGKPVAGAKFTMVINEYDSKTYRYHRKRGQTLTSDAEGKVSVEATNKDYRYFYVDITNGTDRFVSNRQHYQYKPYKREKYEHVTTYFFTDRKIYRPGQTIHFKGIQISTLEGREPQLVTNNSATVELKDVNY
ncbi:MAG TPA: hypothetical protein VD905_08790, partial [Flavobacteriales bacterium]|nr:hypothetical protein [Flavobacteriales bacterium]